jgi:aspartyl aminopeptidase
LCLKGVVLKTDGSLVEVSIGDAPGEPVLVISDLLPHLDKEDKKVSEKFLGEDLSPIAGTIPLENEEKEAVKLYVLKLLNEKYGVTEKDLIGADLSLVPAFETRGAGLDSSLIAGYGHDDRVCAYTAFRAIIDSKSQKRSSIVLLFDREEIGSDGNTGAKERFWIRVLKKIVEHNNPNLDVEDLIEKSAVLSGDVAAGLDPKYKTVMEPLNAPKLGYGTVLVKYTGVRGKSGTSEASAEFFGKIRNLFIENDVSWQVGELGKVDQGGGGTVAKFFAELGSWVLDVGPAVLGMHSPYELVSKADVLETYLAYKTFLENFSG